MHEPVLLQEALACLEVRGGGIYLDGTAGGGGHTQAILDAVGPGGRVIALDRDLEAVARLKVRFCDEARCQVLHGNFGDMVRCAALIEVSAVDGILLDLGVSSFQLDGASRGFSFSQEGPLDMRMNSTEANRAEDLLDSLSDEALADVFYQFGEIRESRRLARAVKAARRAGALRTTRDLAEVAARELGGHRGKTHPATRVFQALRMAVNDELGSLSRGLETGLALLRPGGRMAVISFHSLEDRLVKHTFRRHAGAWESLAAGGRRWVGADPAIRLITRHPLVASVEEQARNPRSRSAKLRAAERLAEEGGVVCA